MTEQTGLLAEDHGEWIFLTDSEDDEEAERVWKTDKDALSELQGEGWEIVQGLAPVRFDVESSSPSCIWAGRCGRQSQESLG